jgi:hypothetical protein
MKECEMRYAPGRWKTAQELSQKPFGIIRRHTLEGNIKMDLKLIGLEGMDWVHRGSRYDLTLGCF